MANSTILGRDEAILQAPRKSMQRGNGIVVRDRYLGSHKAIDAKFKELANSETGGDMLDMSSNGAFASLEVETLQSSTGGSGGETGVISEVWELMPLEIQKPIEALFASADQDEIKAARIAFDTQKEYTGTDNDAKNYLKFREKLIESFTVSAYVIRKTSVVASDKAISAPWATINTAIGFHEIDGDGVPEILRGAIPADWEWLVKTPTYRQVGNGRFQMVQEWYGAEKWSNLLYGGTDEP